METAKQRTVAVVGISCLVFLAGAITGSRAVETKYAKAIERAERESAAREVAADRELAGLRHGLGELQKNIDMVSGQLGKLRSDAQSIGNVIRALPGLYQGIEEAVRKLRAGVIARTRNEAPGPRGGFIAR